MVDVDKRYNVAHATIWRLWQQAVCMHATGIVSTPKLAIQQDGAKNHIHEDDKLFNDALSENGVIVELYTQAANSPDVNLFDLGFFRAIQSFNDAVLRNEEELIKVVSEAYNKYPQEKIN